MDRFRHTMDTDEEAPDSKKRELRAGGRKVTTLQQAA
jgi:hypothetical protein